MIICGSSLHFFNLCCKFFRDKRIHNIFQVRGEKTQRQQSFLKTKLIISPWKRAGPSIWTNLNPLHPGILCAKFGWNWPSGSGEEDENVKSLQTDRQTTHDRWSEKLTWAFSSGELKKIYSSKIILFLISYNYTDYVVEVQTTQQKCLILLEDEFFGTIRDESQRFHKYGIRLTHSLSYMNNFLHSRKTE